MTLVLSASAPLVAAAFTLARGNDSVIVPLHSSLELLFELGSTMLTSKPLWPRCADFPKPAHQCNGPSRPACHWQCQHDSSWAHSTMLSRGHVAGASGEAHFQSDELVKSLYHTIIMMPTIGPRATGSAAKEVPASHDARDPWMPGPTRRSNDGCRVFKFHGLCGGFRAKTGLLCIVINDFNCSPKNNVFKL